MNNIIKKQLENVTSTEIVFNDDTTEILIPKTIKVSNMSLKKDATYLIELEDFIINPTDESTLASNWNNGVIPQYKKYVVEIVDKMGKMIKVNGVAIDNPVSNFYGWLPDNGFNVLERV